MGLLVLSVAACGGRAKPIHYWTLDDDHNLGVLALSGPNRSCAVVRTVEAESEVQVVVECDDPFLSAGSSGGGYRHEFVIQLNSALGDRVVLDGHGTPAELCPRPRCL